MFDDDRFSGVEKAIKSLQEELYGVEMLFEEKEHLLKRAQVFLKEAIFHYINVTKEGLK